MQRRDRLLLALGVGSALALGALGILRGQGTLDAPDAPEAGDGTTGSPVPRRSRGLPALAVPAGLPPPAAEALRGSWRTLDAGTAEEAAAALRALAPDSAAGPFPGLAPLALEALAPSLEVLIGGGEAPLPVAALRAAAALARSGGEEGRRALSRSGLLGKAFVLQAVSGPLDLRCETARLLGLVGGGEAVEWLDLLLRKAPEAEVRIAAVEALGAAFEAGSPLTPEAVGAIRGLLQDRGSALPLRIACLRTLARAWEAFAGTDAAVHAAAALADPGTRLDAAQFFDRRPLRVGGPALLEALRDPDPRIVEVVAHALVQIRPDGTHEALSARLGTLRDPAASRSVARAMEETRPR